MTLKPKTVTQMGLFSGGPWGLAALLALSEWAAVVMSQRRLLSVLGGGGGGGRTERVINQALMPASAEVRGGDNCLFMGILVHLGGGEGWLRGLPELLVPGPEARG